MQNLKNAVGLVARILNREAVDNREWGRILPQFLNECLHVFFSTMQLNLHTPGAVENPTSQGIPFSQVENDRSKSHALDNPGYVEPLVFERHSSLLFFDFFGQPINPGVKTLAGFRAQGEGFQTRIKHFNTLLEVFHAEINIG